MAKKKVKQSLDRTTAVSRTKKVKAASFLSNYPEIDEYLDNFSKDKKYLLLQGGTVELQETIFNYVFEKVLPLISPYEDATVPYGLAPYAIAISTDTHPRTHTTSSIIVSSTPYYSCHLKGDISRAYYFCSYSINDCLNTKDNKIFDTIYDVSDDDLKHIQLILSKILSVVMVVKQMDSQNNFDENRIVEEINQQSSSKTIDDLLRPYEIREGRGMKTGSFTGPGIRKIASVINDMLKSEPTISEKSLRDVLIEKFYEDQFEKLRIVKLLDVSKENKFGFGSRDDRPDFVFATLKEGESMEDLIPMYEKLFKVISLDSKDCNVKEEGIVGADKAKAIESGNKHTNAKKNLLKNTEYIRLDDNDNFFYAKVKGKKYEKQLKLEGQPHALLHHLFNKYDSKSKKASVPIDEILHQANILEHKPGDNISGDKISQLHVKVKAVRDELKSAGFSQAKIIKTMKESGCELYIECSSD